MASERKAILIAAALGGVAFIGYLLVNGRNPSQQTTRPEAQLPIAPPADNFGTQLWERCPTDIAKAGYQEQDFVNEFNGYSELAQQGDLCGIRTLAYMYEASPAGTQQDFPKAFSLLTECAEKGYAGCENDLSFLYRSGLGTVQNDSNAFSWLLKAAQQHYLLAYLPVASYYADGSVTQKNTTEADIWFHRAVAVLDAYAASGEHDKDDVMASVEHQLGHWYEYGQHNDLRAAQSYQKAIDLGHNPGAQEALGMLYWRGQGVQPSKQKAVDLWNASAEQLDGDAFLDLAKAYGEGWGDPHSSFLQSCGWHELAVAAGAEPASVIAEWSASQDFWNACTSWARDFLSKHPGQFRTLTVLGELRTRVVQGSVDPTLR